MAQVLVLVRDLSLVWSKEHTNYINLMSKIYMKLCERKEKGRTKLWTDLETSNFR